MNVALFVIERLQVGPWYESATAAMKSTGIVAEPDMAAEAWTCTRILSTVDAFRSAAHTPLEKALGVAKAIVQVRGGRQLVGFLQDAIFMFEAALDAAKAGKYVNSISLYSISLYNMI